MSYPAEDGTRILNRSALVGGAAELSPLCRIQTRMLEGLFEDLRRVNEFGDDVTCLISSAELFGDDLELQLLVRPGEETERAWKIECVAARSHRVLAEAVTEEVSLAGDHVVLWPHTQDQSELYFRSKCVNPHEVFGALVERHLAAVGNWFSIDRFLNLPGKATDLLRTGHGLIAKGPVPLLSEYSEVLEGLGVTCNTICRRSPKRWDGSQWVEETADLHALIVGDSYVVGPEFREAA